MRLRPWLILATAPLLLAAAPQPVTAPVPLGFWLKDGATATHPGLVGVDQEGPCGPIARLRVDRIPDFRPSDPFAAVEAVELDGKGTAIRRWRLPADYVVSALDGDWLLAAYAGKSDPLWVDPAGRIGVASAADAGIALGDDSTAVVTCPAGAQGPDGAQCLSVRDRSRNVRRIIAAPGVCS
ncbi:hypothetical protein [Inquilinus limosus]|uniref:Uncharacterized protein n=1 Tax=Inquilinus limosus MP06 TaxID=1398085 RepID=A0A0A0D997_9PROT|nr:hypothetical protein [Inquilinus limosus]KGM34714.1 hypothetical protein P409_08590 [Inquilinus limosus MP06]